MAVYTPLEAAEVRALGAEFGLDVEAFHPMTQGSGNTNYRLATAQGPFMLTLMEDSSAVDAKELAHILAALATHGIRTNAALPTRDGRAATTYRGKPVMVKRYLDGRVHRTLEPEALDRLGQEIARLHEVPPPAFLADRHPDDMWKATTLSEHAPGSAFADHVASRLAAYHRHDNAALPHGLLHGDICYDNVLLEGRAFTALIDFEEAIVGPRVVDLGMALAGTCATGDGLSVGSSHALVAGYQRVRPLEPVETAALPRSTEYAALLVASWRFWKYHVDAPTPKRATWHLDRLRIAEAARGMPEAAWATIAGG